MMRECGGVALVFHGEGAVTRVLPSIILTIVCLGAVKWLWP